MDIKTWLQQVSVPVYILVMLFAMSSWIDLTGLYVELPLLVNTLPEGWKLPSYLLLIMECSNISPLIYTLLLKKWPNKIKEWPVIYFIITVGCISCFLLVFFWDFTSTFNGVKHSTGLFIFVFTLSIVDTTSTVVYLPYMNIFKPQYLTAYYTGEGLSGIAGVLGIIQGANGDPNCENTSYVIYNETTGNNETVWDISITYDPPRFSVEVYYLCLTGIMIVSLTAFSCLHFMPWVKKHHTAAGNDKTNKNVNYTAVDLDEANSAEKAISEAKHEEKKIDYSDNAGSLSKVQYVYILALTCVMGSLQYSIISATQTYAILPYGDSVYSLVVRMSTIVTMLCHFFTLFVPSKSVKVVSVLASIGILCSIYSFVLAVLSPNPPLRGNIIGVIIVVVISIIPSIVFPISRVYIAMILKEYRGRMALVYCGAVTQIGTICGTITCFLLINVLELFESIPKAEICG